MLQVRDQMAQLAAENGLKVSDGIADSLLPTPAVGHIRNHDEPIEDYMARRQKMEDGEYRGMPGVSLGVAVRMEMLPTPNTMEHREIKTPEQIAEMKAKSPGGYRNLRESVINELLPTPIVRDYKDGSAAQERDGKVSTDTVARAIFNSGEVLLGTPRTSSANSPSSKQVENGADKARLEDQVRSANEGYISWGKFEPAIRRWEQVLGRPAPAPTKPDGKDGNHRLAAEFTEWMMGLPIGHVTDPALGLTRVEMLKLCGNGVVPQQAKLALEILLDGVDW
jgi:DNA (cytosine-5)-methyltransferase 1